jgi:hypothetical protein
LGGGRRKAHLRRVGDFERNGRDESLRGIPAAAEIGARTACPRDQKMKRNIREFIRDKRKGTEPLSEQEESPGFRGWHSRGYVPHFDAPGVLG